MATSSAQLRSSQLVFILRNNQNDLSISGSDGERIAGGRPIPREEEYVRGHGTRQQIPIGLIEGASNHFISYHGYYPVLRVVVQHLNRALARHPQSDSTDPQIKKGSKIKPWWSRKCQGASIAIPFAAGTRRRLRSQCNGDGWGPIPVFGVNC